MPRHESNCYRNSYWRQSLNQTRQTSDKLLMNKATLLAGDTNTARDTYRAYHVRSRDQQQSAHATEHS